MKARFLLFLSLAGASGCAAILGAEFGDFERAGIEQPDVLVNDGGGGGSNEQPNDAAVPDGEAGGSPCPGTAGPRGTRVHAEAGTWCTDSTEVTRAQYAVFAASASFDDPRLPSFCSWKTSYTPTAHWNDSPRDDRPVTRVDWCDAYMYCTWAGKRLCGEYSRKTLTETAPENADLTLSCPSDQTILFIAFASFGTPTTTPDGSYARGACHAKGSWGIMTSECVDKASCTVRASTDFFGDPCPNVTKKLNVRALCGKRSGGGDAFNQWGSACTNDDRNRFPYGNVFDPTRCNGKETDSGALAPVTSYRGCEGSRPGLFDMSGNASEWVDGCGPGNQPGAQNEICSFRGGSFSSDGQGLRCGDTFLGERNTSWDDVGFRCCSAE